MKKTDDQRLIAQLAFLLVCMHILTLFISA
jgi:hypothetical protein